MLPAVARDTPESSSVRVLMVALHTVIHTLTRHTTLACLSVYPPRLRLSQVGGRYSTGAVCRAAVGVGEAGYPLPVSLSLHGHTSVHSSRVRAKHSRKSKSRNHTLPSGKSGRRSAFAAVYQNAVPRADSNPSSFRLRSKETVLQAGWKCALQQRAVIQVSSLRRGLRRDVENMEWPDEKVLHLIEAYHGLLLLWIRNVPKYKHKAR
ncbi:hypothetical protein J6590_035375 [Homalodisca vitripennis]|nr:hypothetical protein J6590_035375 [Homalodisca vitripennis]